MKIDDQSRRVPDQSTDDGRENNCQETLDLKESRRKLQTLLDKCGSIIFCRFNDESERCRELSLRCSSVLARGASDFGKHIPFLMSAILARFPAIIYDEDLQIFVHDMKRHEEYKRGIAVERQDKENLLSGVECLQVVEKSEELRLLLCKLISSLFRGSIRRGSISMLNPYLIDIVLALHSLSRDPFSLVKIEASSILVQLMRVPQWEMCSKHFSIGLARAAIPNLRHRNSNVRLASVILFEACVCVPDREKMKGAGSEAIIDLVGFREENVLPIGAFYKSSAGVSVNTLAELVCDKNSNVRSKCCSMVANFLVCLPDRYDHQQRLLPYLLSFFNDDVENIRLTAMSAVENCGQQYEVEHTDDVIERRQYGIDGDLGCNHTDPLPMPFQNRPTLGARLFVRANTKRFFQALMNELGSWLSAVKERSVCLLRILVVYCEEHLTMEFHQTLPKLLKALEISRRERHETKENQLEGKMLDIFVLLGRYISPKTYVPLVLPRISGNIDSRTSFSEGCRHSGDSRAASAASLNALLKGSSAKAILPEARAIFSCLTSAECLGRLSSSGARIECACAVITLLQRFHRISSREITDAHFQETGRLIDLNEVISKCGEPLSLLLDDDDKELALIAREGVSLLHA